MDNELEQVFVDVGSLPTMVTPVYEPDGALCMTPAECPVIVAPGVSSCVIQPLLASSPAGPDVGSPGFSHPSTGSVGDLFLLSHAADLNQAQPEDGLSFTEDLAGGLFPAIPLTPVPTTAGGPDLSREGPCRMTSYDEGTMVRILHRHTESNYTIRVCWNTSVLRNLHD